MAEHSEAAQIPASTPTAQDPLQNEAQTSSILDPVEGANVPSGEEEDETRYITGVKLHAILFGLTLVAFLIMLDQTIVGTALPRITSTFNSIKDIGWYGSAYMLATAALQPFSGKMYQYYSSKILFLTAVALFEIGSLICALSQSSKVFIVGRAVAGCGGAFLLTGLLTIISASLPLSKRPKYLGAVLGISSLGIVVGPLLGGVITQKASWRWCFWINLPIGGITAIVLSLIQIPNASEASTSRQTFSAHFNRLDFPGLLFFAPTCIMLLLALDWGGVTYPWSSATVIGLFCGCVGALIVFLLVERYQKDIAMIPLSMLRMPIFSCAGLTAALNSGSLVTTTFYLPIWFQSVKNVGPILSGVYILPMIGSVILSSVLTGQLVSRTGHYTSFAILGCALTAISAGLFSTLVPTSSAGAWAGYQIIAGFGRGMVQQQPVTAMQTILPPSKLPIGNAFAMFAQLLGGAIILQLAQTLFANQVAPALEIFSPGVDAQTVLSVGATAFRSVVSPEEVAGVVLAYNRAISRAFYLAAGVSCLSVLTGFGLGWKNLKVIKEAKAAKAEDGDTIEEKV